MTPKAQATKGNEKTGAISSLQTVGPQEKQSTWGKGNLHNGEKIVILMSGKGFKSRRCKKL